MEMGQNYSPLQVDPQDAQSDSDGEHETIIVDSANTIITTAGGSQRAAAADPRPKKIVLRTATPPGEQTIAYVTKSDVTVGPTTIIEKQIVADKVVKASFLCIECESVVHVKRTRCSLVIFLCWTLLVTSMIGVYIGVVVMPEQQAILELDLPMEWYLPRNQWQPTPRTEPRMFLKLPVKYVLIGHTASQFCNSLRSCKEQLRFLHELERQRGSPDVRCNFLVGGQGFVFEGTGANVASEKLGGWERRSISVAFIGDYNKRNRLQPEQLRRLGELLEALVRRGVLSSDYVLFAKCQKSAATDSPGKNILRKLELFYHWNKTDSDLCLPGLTLIKRSAKYMID